MNPPASKVSNGTDASPARTGEILHEGLILRTLIDNLPDLVFIKDAQSRFVILNTACAQQLGASCPEEGLGRSDADFVSPELAAQYLADEQALMRSGQPVTKEESTQHKTLGMRWSLTTKVPLKDESGHVTGLIGIAIYHPCLNFGEHVVSAGAASLLINSAPVWTAILAALVLKEKIGVRKIVGIAVSVVGVALLALGKGLTLEPAALLIVGAAFCHSCFVIVQKMKLSRFGALEFTLWSMCAGVLWLLTMMAQVFAKRFRADIQRRFLCFALFWHALDIIWVAVFSVVYLLGSGT